MTVPVRYRCPRCGAIASLDREPVLADKSVTPYPLEGWTYVEVDQDYASADGVRIQCGGSATEKRGCGEPFYLNFVRFRDGREIEPPAESVTVEISDPVRPTGPRWPTR